MPPKARPPVDRFWEMVDKNGPILVPKLGRCWEFESRLSSGYGRLKMPDKTTELAHRFSWKLHNGPIPDGLFVCHKCDNKPCVRPTHLFVGTQLDNLADMIKKGRAGKAIGTQHGMSKLSEKDVLDILRKYATGKWTQQELGDLYGVGNMQVSRIVRGERWAHLRV